MLKRLLILVSPLPALFCLSSCDNVGLAFDPSLGGNGGNGSATFIQPMVNQGVTVDGRPKVQHVFPEGNGWSATVPIVVVFNESINQSTVAPGGAASPSLQVRLVDPSSGGTGGINPGGSGSSASSPIAANYNFLFGGRVVVIRPTVPFDSGLEQYEVAITSDLRDTDGVRFTSSTDRVIATFTPDQDKGVEDANVLTVLPVDNEDDCLREAAVYAIFTKPAEQSSVITGAAGNFWLRTGGSAVAATVSFPFSATGLGASGQDGRIVKLEPTALLAASSEYDIVFNDTITFGSSGKLDFSNRTPFASFSTVAPESVTSVTIGNSPAGTTDKVSVSNISTVLVDVELPASTLAGDQVNARIYGLDKEGGNTGAANFVERSKTVPANGAQAITLDFGGLLGTPAEPAFLEGALLLAATLSRGGTQTGYVVSSSATTNPRLDVTIPTLELPTSNAAGETLYLLDQEYLAFFGTASEDLHTASLVLDSGPAPTPALTTGTLFGLGAGSKFMFDPILLGRRTSPLGFTLTITDEAGNIAPAVNGLIVQRGVVTGDLSGGTLTVEAYDDATMAPVVGATVLVDSGLPTTSTANRVTGVTGSDGRAIFTGLAGPPAQYSVTLIQDGYNLVSLLNSPAGFMSLPMRPMSGATATLKGRAIYSASTGTSVLVGTNILDDVLDEEIKTSTANPTDIPDTAVRPNRPYTLTAFSGTFEPTTKSTFTGYACNVCGVTGLLKEAMEPPIAVGDEATENIGLLPSAQATVDLAASYTKDLGDWVGLDAADLVGNPTVRVMASLFGIPGMTLVGVGYSELSSGTAYVVDGSYSLGIAVATASLGPKFWVSTEATDNSGNVARHRRIIVNTTLGTTFASTAVPGIPTITAPSGASAGSPSVTYEDRLSGDSIPNGIAFQVLTATDTSGRAWRIIEQDTTSLTASVDRQLPVLTGVAIPGLAAGSWSISAESVLIYSFTFGAGDYLLEELRREEVTYSRAAAKSFTVN